MLNPTRAFLLLALPSAICATVSGQEAAPAPTATLKFTKSSVAPGALVEGTLTVTFAPGLHGYQNPPSPKESIPVEVKVREVGFKLVKASYPKGKVFRMTGEPTPLLVYQGSITIPIKLKASTKPNNYNVNLEVDYQQCNATSCFPPATVVVKAPLIVK